MNDEWKQLGLSSLGAGLSSTAAQFSRRPLPPSWSCPALNLSHHSSPPDLLTPCAYPQRHHLYFLSAAPQPPPQLFIFETLTGPEVNKGILFDDRCIRSVVLLETSWLFFHSLQSTVGRRCELSRHRKQEVMCLVTAGDKNSVVKVQREHCWAMDSQPPVSLVACCSTSATASYRLLA